MGDRSSKMIFLAWLLLLWPSSVLAQQDASVPIYRFDPALSVSKAPQPSISAGPQVVVDEDETKTSIRLESGTPLAPYVEAERGPEMSPEEERLLLDKPGQGLLSDYKLEAGVGLFIEDRASFNLGYRFHEQPSLLGDRREDPLSLSGDLRISFDIKVPFD